MSLDKDIQIVELQEAYGELQRRFEELDREALESVELLNEAGKQNQAKDGEIESLRAELADRDRSWQRVVANKERQWDEAWHISQTKIIDLLRERDEARQAKADLLAELKVLFFGFHGIGNQSAAGVLKKVIDQYDTAQPTAQGEAPDEDI